MSQKSNESGREAEAREETIFLAALEISDTTQRSEYLNLICGSDQYLREQVEILLATHERSGEFLKVPVLQQMLPDQPGDPNFSSEELQENSPLNWEINLAFLETSTAPNSLGRLKHYEIEEVVGRGGCGIVLKALDTKLHRVVAIKVMASELASTSPARQRFLREARATAAIRHENVISIYAVEEDPLPFLVMEYIDGQTLQQKLDATGPLPLAEVLEISRQIATGLEAAHASGMIHRDIKPANILLERVNKRVKITDFGLARSVNDASLTQSGVISGTPLYMSPEQAEGIAISQVADLFSLGSVMYVMCSGRPPFRAPSTLAVLKRVVEEQPRPIREIIPEVPDWLANIIQKLHAKNPAERFASVTELVELLTQCQAKLQNYDQVTLPDSTARGSVLDGLRDLVIRRSSPSAPGLRHKSARSVRNAVRVISVLAVVIIVPGMTDALGVTDIRGAIFQFFDPHGTLVMEIEDPRVSLRVNGKETKITGVGTMQIRVKPGQYHLEVIREGQVIQQKFITVPRNGRQVVRIHKPLDNKPSDSRPPVPSEVAETLPVPYRPQFYTNALGMKFARIPGGKSWLGGERRRSGKQEVVIADDFYLGVYEVTQAEWKEVMGRNPSFFQPGRRGGKQIQDVSAEDLQRFPVELITWEDTQRFLSQLNLRLQEKDWYYRLPTEVEWEYACRGGPMSTPAESAFNYYLTRPANQITVEDANIGNVIGRTCRVGSYQPSRLGLYDMHGNVYEWCNDRVLAEDGTQRRPVRGGGYFLDARACKATKRNLDSPTFRNYLSGLRVARVPRGSRQ